MAAMTVRATVRLTAGYLGAIICLPGCHKHQAAPQANQPVQQAPARAVEAMRRLPPNARPVKPEGHLGKVTCLSFSPDGRRLLSGSEDRTLLIWDWEKRKIIQRLEGHQGFIYACSFFPDGRRVISGGWRGELFIWDAKSAKVIQRLEGLSDAHSVYSLGLRRDSNEVIAGAHAGRVQAWDLETGRVTWSNDELAGNGQSFVMAVGYREDGSRFAAGPQGFRAWQEEGDAVKCAETIASATPLSGNRLALGKSASIEIMDGAGKQKALVATGLHGWVYALSRSPQGDRLAAAGDESRAGIWDAETGKPQCNFPINKGSWSATFHPNGNQVAFGLMDGTIASADTRTCQLGTDLTAARSRAMSLASGSSLLVGDGAGRVASWDFAHWRLQWSEPFHDGLVVSLATLSKGRWASGGYDNAVRLGQGRESSVIGQAINSVYALKPMPQQEGVLAADMSGKITYFGQSTQRELYATPQEQSLFALAVSPNGSHAIAGGAMAQLIRIPLPTGEPQFWEDGMLDIESTTRLEYNSQGQWLAQGGTRGTVLLRNASDGAVQRKLLGLKHQVSGFVFSQGFLWAGAMDDKLARWPLSANNDSYDRAMDLSAPILGLTLTDNGRALAAALEDGRVVVRSLPEGDPVAQLFILRDGSWAAVHADGSVELEGKMAAELRFELPDTRKVIALGTAAGQLLFTTPTVERLGEGDLLVHTTVLSPTGVPTVQLDGQWTVRSVQPSPTVLSAYDVEVTVSDDSDAKHRLTARAPERDAVVMPIEPPPMLERGRVAGRALLVANSAYQEPLAGTTEDAEAMSKALRRSDSWGLRPDDTLLVRRDLGPDQLQSTVRDFFYAAKPGEILLFHYAGHGDYAEGEAYLVPVPPKTGSRNQARLEGAISATNLWTWILASKAQQVLVILDACHAGGFSFPVGLSRQMEVGSQGPQTAVLMATTALQTAPGSSAGGRFTQALVDAMQHFDATDSNGRVTAEDALSFALRNRLVREQQPRPFGSAEAMRIPLAWPATMQRTVLDSRSSSGLHTALIARANPTVVATRQFAADATTSGHRGKRKDRLLEIKLGLLQDIQHLRVALKSLADDKIVYENFRSKLRASEEPTIVEQIGHLAPGLHHLVLQACQTKKQQSCDATEKLTLDIRL